MMARHWARHLPKIHIMHTGKSFLPFPHFHVKEPLLAVKNAHRLSQRCNKKMFSISRVDLSVYSWIFKDLATANSTSELPKGSHQNNSKLIMLSPVILLFGHKDIHVHVPKKKNTYTMCSLMISLYDLYSTQKCKPHVSLFISEFNCSMILPSVRQLSRPVNEQAWASSHTWRALRNAAAPVPYRSGLLLSCS